MTSTGSTAVSLEHLPLADTDSLLDTLLEGARPMLDLWAPGFVALDRSERPSLAVGAAGRADELARLMLERRAFVVAIDVERGGARTIGAAAHDGASGRLLPALGYEGGLGPERGPRGAQVARFAMWDRQAPWPPGTYALVAVAADRVSPRVETVLGRATSTVDPAADLVGPESLRVWPPPDPAGNLPHYHPLDQSPAVPAEPGIALVAARVASAGTAVVHGAFRVRLRPRWIVPYGAVVPITLVLTGSEDPAPFVLPLRLPSFDRVDAAGTPSTVTGRFALDLLQLAPLAAARAQTWFLHAFSSEASAGPLPIAVAGRAHGAESP
ncbi:MAG TPA: hypothetical protein VGL81_23070 [Polyangiaceae bacterium]